MQDLNKFLKDVKGLEKSLFALVLSSFVFSLIAVLAQYDKFDLPFKALTELIGGIFGSAGVLSVYMGNLRHPKDEFDYVMDFRPAMLGLRTSVSFFLSATSLYIFYFYASEKKEICLLFLALGVFLFFRALAHAAITLRRSEMQRLVWSKMTIENRVSWLKQQQKLEKLIEEAQATGKEVDQSLKKIEHSLKASKREERKHRVNRVLRQIHKWSISIRHNIAGDVLLTNSEKIYRELEELETDENWADLEKEIVFEHLNKIQRGDVQPKKLEAADDLEFFNLDDRYYFFLPTVVNSNVAEKIVQTVSNLSDVLKETKSTIIAVIPQDGRITIDAEKILRGAKLDVVSRRTDNHKPENGIENETE